MDWGHYLAHVRTRLAQQGFAELSDLPAELSLAMMRSETWGDLLLMFAPPDLHDHAHREALVGVISQRMLDLQRNHVDDGAARRRYAILIFSYGRTPSDAESKQILSLLCAEPAAHWRVIPWVLDLEVGLIDQHRESPAVNARVAQALTEFSSDAPREQVLLRSVPQFSPQQVVRSMTYLPATRSILAGTVAFYLWVLLSSGNGAGALVSGPTLAQLLRWGAIHGRLVLQQGEQWRLLTYLFLHGGWLHLGMNMWAFWNLGRHVEMIYGSRHTLFIYIAAGIAGGFASTALRPEYVPSVGASGAIFGLMGALFYFARSRPWRSVDWRSLFGPLAINLLFGLVLRNIDNYAHVGGLIGGFCAAFVAGVPGERQSWRTWALYAVSLLLLAVLAGIVRLPYLPLPF